MPPSLPVSYHARIAALQARIVMAESERNGWFAVNDQDRFTKASQRVDSLALELWELRMHHLRDHTGGA